MSFLVELFGLYFFPHFLCIEGFSLVNSLLFKLLWVAHFCVVFFFLIRRKTWVWCTKLIPNSYFIISKKTTLMC